MTKADRDRERICRCGWKAEAINGTVYAASIKGPKHTPARVPNRQLSEADHDGHEGLAIGATR